MNIRYIFSSLLLLLPGALLSQVPLTVDPEFMQGGDILCRAEVPYVSPGADGKDAEWKLCRISESKNDLWQTVSKSDAGIDILEYDRRKHFELRDDILYYMRDQNGKSFVEFGKGRPLLKYPFQYGDSISSIIDGKGCNEEGLSYVVSVDSYTVADGVGSLSDSKDEIKGITRLHLHDEMKKTYEDGTAEHLVSDRYLWYGNGRRYPVMESVRSLIEKDGASDVLEQVSYCYFLAQSMTNDGEPSDKDAATAGKEDGYSSRRIEIVKAVLSPADLQLTVDYNLDEETVFSVSATDIAGNMLGSGRYHSEKGGDGHVVLSLAHRPVGGVLMLNVRNGYQQVSVKVTE